MYTVYWLIAVAVFLLLEILTLGLTSIWFAVGSLAAAIGAGSAVFRAADPGCGSFLCGFCICKAMGPKISEQQDGKDQRRKPDREDRNRKEKNRQYQRTGNGLYPGNGVDSAFCR